MRIAKENQFISEEFTDKCKIIFSASIKYSNWIEINEHAIQCIADCVCLIEKYETMNEWPEQSLQFELILEQKLLCNRTDPG